MTAAAVETSLILLAHFLSALVGGVVGALMALSWQDRRHRHQVRRQARRLGQGNPR